MTKKTTALLCKSLSEGFEGISLETLSLPKLKETDLLINVKASSVNFPDLLMSQGKYQHKPKLPFVLGMEGAGIIIEKGNLVSKFKVGDEVCFGSWGNGTFSQHVIVPEENARLKPNTLSFIEASAFQTAFLTAYVALIRLGKLKENETLLVHGATGGVGMAAVQLGAHIGANVIATGTSKDKLETTLEWGANQIVVTSQDNHVSFREEIKNLTEGKGADVIYDPIGGDIFDESLRCINWGGRILVIGFAGGRIPNVPVNIPLIKGFSVVGVRAGEFGRKDPKKGLENLEEIYKLANENILKPYICKIFSLEDGLEALKFMNERKVIGKVVISMD
ncbi:MAG: NADPH:quinone oxidoreductase family protein [SAR86 cluster bacterium]|nr:NADPH:quinone oxidoreductase family protein [SAR86 cluster bacterium]